MKYVASMEYLDDYGVDLILEYDLVLAGEDTRISDGGVTLQINDLSPRPLKSLAYAFEQLSLHVDEVRAYHGSYARWYSDLLENGLSQHDTWDNDLDLDSCMNDGLEDL